MAFFDELGKKITQTSQGASKAMKNMAEVTKINGMISEEERRLAGYYQEIGRIYCEKYAGVENKSDLEGYVNAVRESAARISQYRQQITQLKGVRSCPSCGAEVPNNTLYCSNCGAQMPPMPIQPAPIQPANQTGAGTTFCQNCGAPLESGAMFCTECGSPVTAAGSASVAPAQETPQPSVYEEESLSQPAWDADPAAPYGTDYLEQEQSNSVSLEKSSYIPPETDQTYDFEAEPVQKVCPNCGKILDAKMMFCTGCGTRLD